MIKFSPLTQKKIARFRSIRRGYWSFIILMSLFFLALFAEIFINSRALVVRYQGEFYLPTYGAIISGETFDLGYPSETNYRELKQKLQQGRLKNQQDGDFVLMPLVPWNPFEQDFGAQYPPTAPSAETQHYLGTDNLGRDIVARLVYGFRIAMGFAVITMMISYTIGVVIGCMMGFWGGRFDLFMQRGIEVWSMVPFLYVIMILVSITKPTFFLFTLINVLFGWMGMTWYMRSMTYKEKARDYVLAARALGASNWRILFKHILPNVMVMIVTLAPFTIVGNITALTALDYLGLGLTPPTPSWGELLQQGKSSLDSPWIASSVVASIVGVLMMVTFIGEAVREAFDPKKFTQYR